MRLPLLPCAFVTLGLVGSACSDTAAPGGIPAVSLEVERDTLVASMTNAGSVTWMTFTVPVSIHNMGARTVTFSSCNAAIAAPSGTGTYLVWMPICSLDRAGTVAIGPGDTRHVEVRVNAAVEGPGAPAWNSEVIDGSYRLGVRLAPLRMKPTGVPAASGDLANPLVLSDEFTLVVKPWETR